MLTQLDTPQLQCLHRGKVRDSFRIDGKTRLIVVTDRISAFDYKLTPSIPSKGEILNRLSAHWFNQTKHIFPNHMISMVDPQAMLVREAVPIRAEMIVRGYIAGSIWRAYHAGRRRFCGVELAEGLFENARLPTPIVTPTTKEDSDQETSQRALVAAGALTDSQYTQMHAAALELFAFGTKYAEERGLLLADTKYEFGTIGGEILLIDEMHTPDSSRYWDMASYRENPVGVIAYDKEYVRAWMKANQRDGTMPLELSAEVVAGTTERYAMLMQRLTGESLPANAVNASARLRDSLVAANFMHDAYVVIVTNAAVTHELLEPMAAMLRAHAIDVRHEQMNADNTAEQVAARYNPSLESGVVVVVTTESDLHGRAAKGDNSDEVGSLLATLINLPVVLYHHSDAESSADDDGQLGAALDALAQLNLRRVRDHLLQARRRNGHTLAVRADAAQQAHNTMQTKS
jgi:fusion protein PurCD